MKKIRWKEMLVCICVLAAGIYYLVSGAGAGMESRPWFVTGGTLSRDLAEAEAENIFESAANGQTEANSGNRTDDGAEANSETGAADGAEANSETGAAGRAVTGGSGLGGEHEKDTETAGTLLYVHVCGEVMSPGVYALKPGSRVYEAVEMAGGATDRAAPDALNMAMAVEDGMRIEVPDQESAALADSGQSGLGMANITVPVKGRESKMSGSGKVNINTASREQLMQLSGIGEARAEAIIAFRETNGPFGRIEDIMGVSGIKEAAFQKIRDSITV